MKSESENKTRRGVPRDVTEAVLAGGLILAVFFFILKPPAVRPGEVIPKNRTFDGESAALAGTVISPILDSTVPEHKNVVWCSSFQLAWNELKGTIIGEPILLDGAQAVAERLNNAEQTTGDVSKNDVYARAGLVRDGITETIRSEMARRFGPEAAPDFNDVSADTEIVAYAYLNANVRFGLPYFENDDQFAFTDSRGEQTAICSFGLREKDDYAYEALRRQVEVLFCDWDSDYQATAYALDLDKESSPNQIIVAMIERPATLLDGYKEVERKSRTPSEVRNSRDFGPNDILLVPNFCWRISHRFAELERANLQNAGFERLYIERAMQVINFRLDRSGAELESEAKLYVAPEPTEYLFDRPFLIYMKKRGAAYPFFVMWVDNAELLEPFSSKD